MSVAVLCGTGSVALLAPSMTDLGRGLQWYGVALLLAGLVAWAVHYFLLRRAVPPSAEAAPGLAGRWLLAGVGAALVPQALVLAVGSAAGVFAPTSPGYAPYAGGVGLVPPPGGLMWVFFAVQSSFEEALFRGVLFALLACLLIWLAGVVLVPDPLQHPAGPDEAWRRNVWFYAGLITNCVVSLGFAAIHSHNPNVSAFALCNIGLAGFALGQLYWLQGNLWGCCAMHTVWNAALATLGLPVSGILVRGPLVGHIHGAVPGLLTGGSFGPEASAVTTAGFVLVSLLLVWLSWKRATSPDTDLYAGAEWTDKGADERA